MDAKTIVSLLTEGRAGYVRLARRRLPTEADAEDLVQRAMVRAADRAALLDDPTRVGPWFARILSRGIADFYRSKRPDALTETGDVDAVAPTEETDGNLCTCSLNLMGALRPAYQEVLRHVDVEGMSTDAVALLLGITPANLHVRLHRARQALRARVEAHCGVTSCGPCLDCTCSATRPCGS